MKLPFAFLTGDGRELGLIVAVAIGVAFGFVLERAGFGHARKLTAQFYGSDMTVLKVMFTAIVTAMLGTVLADGVGLVDLRALADGATSVTYLWPMLAAGLVLGVGFVISGYCPGTSAVAMASGKLDGFATVLGVIVGSVALAEVQPALGALYTAGELGHFYLYDWLGIPPAAVAVLVTAMAIAMFLGGEAIERAVSGTRLGARRPRLATWAGLGVAAALGLVAWIVPGPSAATVPRVRRIAAFELAERVIAEPWSVRVLDLRARAACEAKRVPGAECVPRRDLPKLALGASVSERDLVLVADGPIDRLPGSLAGYPGRVFTLAGGFGAWQRFALTAPEPPGATATRADRERYQFRRGLYSALTGTRAAPPPPPTRGLAPAAGRKKAGGGGCS